MRMHYNWSSLELTFGGEPTSGYHDMSNMSFTIHRLLPTAYSNSTRYVDTLVSGARIYQSRNLSSIEHH